MIIHQHTSGRVSGPGFYEMAAALYHADPCPEPSLSASIATTLTCETPLHARHAHPRLNPAYERDDGDAAANKGAVAHELILGKGGGFAVLDFEAWTTKASKEARNEARSAGLTPILTRTFAEAEVIAGAVHRTLSWTDDCQDFADPAARSELVMVWQEDDDTWCRAMIDRLTPRGVVYDVKTSGRGLDDRTLRNRFEDGFAIQPAFYLRGLAKLWPEMAGRIRWRWVFCEQTAPFAARVEEAGAFALKLGEQQVAHALRTWARCREKDWWPGYARKVGRLDPADWTYNRWVERLLAEGAAVEPPAPPEPDSLIFAEFRIPVPAEV